MRSVVYLASCYSHADPDVREGRFREACRVAAKLMNEGWTVFSPIAHSHPIAASLDPKLVCDHEFWMRQDLPILAACERMVVLRLPGWEKSRGVAAEMQFASANGIPIEYLDP
jgi:hypothetical protein